MRDSGRTSEDARREMCECIKKNMDEYRWRRNSSDWRQRQEAYKYLGRALHPVMDSTSPVHSGMQEWVMRRDWRKHGDMPKAMEDVKHLTPALLDETRRRMAVVMSGDLSCVCGN
jgi:hypothetical protein